MSRGVTQQFQNVEIEETVDGEFMVLVNGFQWGGEYDRSGAGNATFPTYNAAVDAYFHSISGRRRPSRDEARALRKLWLRYDARSR